MKAIDFSKVFDNYKGLWVALIDENRVIAADKDIQKTQMEASQKGYPNARLFKVPQENVPFVGFHV